VRVAQTKHGTAEQALHEIFCIYNNNAIHVFTFLIANKSRPSCLGVLLCVERKKAWDQQGCVMYISTRAKADGSRVTGYGLRVTGYGLRVTG